MINLLIISFPFLFINTRKFIFILFIAFSLCRYRFNKLKSLLVCSVILSIFSYLSLFLIDKTILSPRVFFAIQIFIAVSSFTYSVKNKLWNEDIIFIIMEPLFVVIFCLYYFIIPLKNIYVGIVNWSILYISLQFMGVCIKLIVGFYLSNHIKNKLTRLKYLIYSIPRFEVSFSLNDLSFLGLEYAFHPLESDILIKESEFFNKKVIALTMNDHLAYKKLIKEQDKFHNIISYKILVKSK